MAHNWRMDDLDGGLAADLSDLTGLGTDLIGNPQVYNMADVLSLSIFQSEEDCYDDSKSTQPQMSPDGGTCTPRASNDGLGSGSDGRFAVLLKAPISLGRRSGEDTLTYLNQGQSSQLLLHCLNGQHYHDGVVKASLRVGFHERKHQVLEVEKFDEWVALHPSERMLEIDAPMCVGVRNITSTGKFANVYDFEWDASAETRLYFKINCVSSEFTRGKSGGESGVILRLQMDMSTGSENGIDGSEDPLCYGCQIKVFKPKGADRKMKSERLKYDALTSDKQGKLQPPCDVTVLQQLSYDASTPLASPQASPYGDHFICSSKFSEMNLSASSNLFQSPTVQPQTSKAAIAIVQALSTNSTVEETQTWLSINRFHQFSTVFANFAGTDLLRLTRDDLIELCGPADGIRLNNALQSRASRPLLTVYVSPGWGKSSAGSRQEYHAVFLEELTAAELHRKLALKCHIDNAQFIGIYKQGPAGILILVDDDMVRNFADESHFRAKMVIEDEIRARVILE